MSVGKARHMFPGGNTTLGFFSYYAHIITQEEAEKIYVIKGGPGVGKSMFMKKVGSEMLQKGYDVEFMHCSSDNNSLDGVVIPALKTALIDGTSPHVVDPKNPGAVDEILNFGDFWDEAGIKRQKMAILKEGKEIGRLFARAYKYLKAAFCIYEDSAEIYNKALNKGMLNILCSQLEKELFSIMDDTMDVGKQRCLFASAITPNGYCNFIDSIIIVDRVYEIQGGMGTGEELLLERIKDTALRKGLNVETYYCPLNPYKLEHLVIPRLNTAFTTSNAYHRTKKTHNIRLNMMDCMDRELLESFKVELDQNRAQFDNLMAVALAVIKKAKAAHDQLETYYIPNINFKAIDRFYDSFLPRLMNRGIGSQNSSE